MKKRPARTFFAAWEFLKNNPIFEDMFGTRHFYESLGVDVLGVNYNTGKNFKSSEPDQVISFRITCDYNMRKDLVCQEAKDTYGKYFSDKLKKREAVNIHLDTKKNTFEEGIIELSVLLEDQLQG